MAWETLDQVQTDAALDFRARHPQAPQPRAPSFWGQVGEFIAAPVKGAGQAGLQSARIVNRVVAPQAGNPLAMSATEQEDMLDDAGITRESQDRALRGGINALKPDPVTSTLASQILQDASRVLTKAGLYAVAGGPVGAVAGTGLDEAGTGYLELRDRGVDRSTAAQVGAVRGAATGLGVALPVAGRTWLQTAGLALLGGPASVIGEQYATRAILEAAHYPEIAAEHDPFDPVALGVSLLVPGAIGAVVHRSRARAKAAEAGEAPTPRDTAGALADDPDTLDAAHVAYRTQEAEGAMLANPAEPAGRAAHSRAMDDAGQALETGEPLVIDPAAVDPQRMQAAMRQVHERMQRVEAEGIVGNGPADPSAALRLEREAEGSATYHILDEGEAVGSISTRTRSTARTDGEGFQEVLQIYNSGIDVPEAMGKGLGIRAYTQLVDEALAGGKQVWSDTSVTTDAQRLYDGLARRGYTVERNPSRPPETEGDGTLTTRGSYVYRVTKGPETAPQQTDAPAPATPMDRAARAIEQRPDLPIRMDDDGSPARPAREVMESAQEMRRMDATDARAFEAAAECLLETAL